MKAYLLVAGLAALVPAEQGGEVTVLFPSGGNPLSHKTALGFFEDELKTPSTCREIDGFKNTTTVGNRSVCWVSLKGKYLALGESSDEAARFSTDYFVDFAGIFERESLSELHAECYCGTTEEPCGRDDCSTLLARVDVKFMGASHCDISGVQMPFFAPLTYTYMNSDRLFARRLAAGLELDLLHGGDEVTISITPLRTQADAQNRTGQRTATDRRDLSSVELSLVATDGERVELIVNNYLAKKPDLEDIRMFDMHSRAILDLSKECANGREGCPAWGRRPFGVGMPSAGARDPCRSVFSGRFRVKNLRKLYFPHAGLQLINLSRVGMMNDDHETPLGESGFFGPPICPKGVLAPPTE